MSIDKQRVLIIISTVIERSRTQTIPNMRLSRNSLLSLMNRRRPLYAQMSRDEFQNNFTTRVDRKNIIPVDDLICLIEAILEHNPKNMTAREVLELCDAARLPLREYKRLPRFFSATEWNSAWRGFDIERQSTIDDTFQLGERKIDFENVLDALRRRKICVVHGEKGIGKTHFARDICCRLEEETHNVVARINGTGLQTLESIATNICDVLNITPFGNETLLQRLAHYSRSCSIIVFIDDYVLSQHDESMSLIKLLHYRLPALHLLLTSEQQPYFEEDARIFCYRMLPISFDGSLELYRKFCAQIGHFPLESSAVLTKLRQCQGVPLAIQLLIATMKEGCAPVEANLRMSQLVYGLTEAQREILATLYLFQGRISVPLLTYVLCQNLDRVNEVFADLNLMAMRGIVAVHQSNHFELQTMLRFWIATTSPGRYIQNSHMMLLTALASNMTDEKVHHLLAVFSRQDFSELARCVGEVMAAQELDTIELCVDVILRWQVAWHTYNLSQTTHELCTVYVSDRNRVFHTPRYHVYSLRAQSTRLGIAELSEIAGAIELEALHIADYESAAQAREIILWAQSGTMHSDVFNVSANQIHKLYLQYSTPYQADKFCVEVARYCAFCGSSALAQMFLSKVHTTMYQQTSDLRIESTIVRALVASENGQQNDAKRYFDDALLEAQNAQLKQRVIEIRILELMYRSYVTADVCVLYTLLSSTVQDGTDALILRLAEVVMMHYRSLLVKHDLVRLQLLHRHLSTIIRHQPHRVITHLFQQPSFDANILVSSSDANGTFSDLISHMWHILKPMAVQQLRPSDLQVEVYGMTASVGQ